ncbi:homeobox protein HMX2-like protein [Anopheles sinensis]|uniref:Homeobox protein HMX2-like protein n=1 Tax=Anopheles sinensis TaxID=74873 RepID=A0A084WJF0_ANOSI|nr:homeobox protein HMX2-like protein [Anopheles sinensis]
MGQETKRKRATQEVMMIGSDDNGANDRLTFLKGRACRRVPLVETLLPGGNLSRRPSVPKPSGQTRRTDREKATCETAPLSSSR